MKKLFLVDAYALIYRMYYAFLNRPMRNSDGMNTSPVFGFVKFLKEIIRRENPHFLGVAFDSKGDTFRHELYPEYKANRDAAPEDIHASVPYIKRIMEAMRIPCVCEPGWEADDLIGTLSCKAEDAGFDVYMVTPDKDFGQLVRRHAFIYKQKKSGEGIDIIGLERIKEIYGVDNPLLIIDILALWGDASDNIPGVPGIGEKTAIKLVNEFGTVEQILENVHQLKGKLKENILENSEQLLMSKRLATIDTDAPVEFIPEELVLEDPDVVALVEIYRELGFNSLIREMGLPQVPKSQNRASDLFTSQETDHSEEQKEQPSVHSDGTTSVAMQQDLFGSSTGTGSIANTAGGFSTINDTHNYTVITDAEELRKLVSSITEAGIFCLETEIPGTDIFSGSPIGIGISVAPGEGCFVVLDDTTRAEFMELLRPVLEDDTIEKIGHNLKFDIMALQRAGIELKGFKYDTMLLHYLIDPESRHTTDYLSRSFLEYNPIDIESLTGRGVKRITIDKIPVDKCAEYAAEYADINFRLKEILWPKVLQEGLEELYRTVEEPLIEVLAQIEYAGVKVDTDVLSESGEELSMRLSALEEEIRSITDEPNLNVNSAKQLGETLFGKLRIDPKPKLTKTKQYRTDEEYLVSLSDRSPVIGLVLEYRGIKKLLSTYIESLPQLINPVTGKIHTSYNQAVTATGRISSSNPNLQNIPIRDEQGRAIRKAFVPSDSEHLLLAADYTQVELRLMAHLSQDKNLLDAFRQGEDVHAATASLLYGVPIPEVTAEHRRRAKTANFGIIYGISAFGLSQRLDIPRAEAKEIIENYFRSYPGVKQYMEDVIHKAKEEGYVTTMFGRKRWLPDISSANAVTRGWAERNAINAPIQGGAADIMKLAMIKIYRNFKSADIRSKVIMQVHDELVIDMYKPEEQQVVEIVTRAMEHAAKLSVELTVGYGIGRNWMEAH